MGFGEDWKARRPDLSEGDLAAAREVMRRKAGDVWVEGALRTDERRVLRDTVPAGPPIRLPPHNLKGESANWVDEKLEEEVRRGQLKRGYSQETPVGG